MRPISEVLQQFFRQRDMAPIVIGVWDVETLADAFRAAELDAQRSLPLQSELLADREGLVQAVIPFGCTLSLEAVERLFERSLEPAPDRLHKAFRDCDPAFTPALGMAYGLTTVVDESVFQASEVIMATGVNGALMTLQAADLRAIFSGVARGSIVDSNLGGASDGPAVQDMARKLESLHRLPPMPAIALRVMQMTAQPETSAAELAAVIERDPSLAAQVLRYARSALFNYPGELRSVQEAVTRVLGFDRVAHLVVGIAASRSFRIPVKGVLGLENFWRHSLHCARLSQAIARSLPAGQRQWRADPEMAYLAGLLHNLGLLLIAHLFPNDFTLLNEKRELDLELPLCEIEEAVFTHQDAEDDALRVGHATAGSILLRLWEMPEPVVRVAGLHEASSYQGEHGQYVLIVQLANELLKAYGIGDEFGRGDPHGLAGRLCLDEGKLDELAATTDDVTAELDQLARGLAG